MWECDFLMGKPKSQETLDKEDFWKGVLIGIGIATLPAILFWKLVLGWGV